MSIWADLAQDVSFAGRTLSKAPGFSIIAVLTLALGVGANSAIFSFVDAALLKPLPYPNPDRIVLVWEKPPGGTRNGISTLNFLDWVRDNTVFDALAANTGGSMTLSGGAEPISLHGARVSAPYFDVFGLKPMLGRTFTPDEDQPGKEHVVVLSHALWVTQFGSDPSIVGRPITLDGEPYAVIGVMPENSPFDRGYSQLWRPIAFKPTERTRNFHWMVANARLKPGVTIEQARASMDATGARIAHDYPDSNKGWGVTIERFQDVVVGPPLKQSLYALLAAVGMLLLIGCANLANLTLARGTSREREVAIRSSIGASRGRLVRQFLTESIVLATAGSLLGLALGYAMMVGLKAVVPPFTLPRDVNVLMDVRVLSFTLLLSVATGVVFGLAPALQATKPDLASAMKESGRGFAGDGSRRRLRSALVVVEVALAFMLLTAAGLLGRSFFRMMDVHTGFDETNVITAYLPMRGDRFPSRAQLVEYCRQIIAYVNAVPGVRESAITSALPMDGWGYGMPFLIAGREAVDRANRQGAFFKMVSPSYFHALGMVLVKGRLLSDRDVAGGSPAMVINQTMAGRYFKTEDPIGHRILVQEIVAGRPELGPEIPWEVVGIVADERVDHLDTDPAPGMYVSLEQDASTFLNLLVRGNLEPTRLQQAIAAAVHAVDKNQPLDRIRTLAQIKTESAASNWLRTMLLGVFAALAVLLCAIGIYGVMSYTVVQRTQELGIRAALGATTGALLTLVMSHGMALATAGLAIGVVGSLALTRLLSTLLFGVGAHDPKTMAGAVATLLLVAGLACYLPARRAARLDPLVALRDA